MTLPLCANRLISKLILSVFNYLSASGRESEVQPAENKKRKTTIRKKQTDRQYGRRERARTNPSKRLFEDVELVEETQSFLLHMFPHLCRRVGVRHVYYCVRKKNAASLREVTPSPSITAQTTLAGGAQPVRQLMFLAEFMTAHRARARP